MIPTCGGVSHHQATSSTFEFLHIYYHKSQNEACKGGNMYVLKGSPLCCGFLHLCPMSKFGIISSLLGGREIYEVVCL
jgi:hypothetical protein